MTRSASGLWGPAAPLGPVVAPLVPRCALLPAPTPRDVLSAVGTSLTPIRLADTSGPDAGARHMGTQRYETVRNLGSTHPAKPHHAGGGGAQERAARHERRSDRPQGAAGPPH